MNIIPLPPRWSSFWREEAAPQPLASQAAWPPTRSSSSWHQSAPPPLAWPVEGNRGVFIFKYGGAKPRTEEGYHRHLATHRSQRRRDLYWFCHSIGFFTHFRLLFWPNRSSQVCPRLPLWSSCVPLQDQAVPHSFICPSSPENSREDLAGEDRHLPPWRTADFDAAVWPSLTISGRTTTSKSFPLQPETRSNQEPPPSKLPLSGKCRESHVDIIIAGEVYGNLAATTAVSDHRSYFIVCYRTLLYFYIF